MKAWKRAAAAAAVAALCVSGAVAQEEDATDDGKNWSNKAEFGFTNTTGNSQTTNLSLADKFQYDWTRSNLVVDAFALQTETTTRLLSNPDGTVRVDEFTEKTAEAYGLAGKYSHQIRDRLSWYAAGRWYRNRLAGIEDRYIAGAGIGYLAIDMEQHRLNVEVGLDYTDESRVGGTSDDWAGARAFGGYLWKFAEKSEFTSELEFLYNFDISEDWRYNWVNSVTTSMTDRLALKVSYAMIYDNQPVVVLVEPDATAPPGTADAPFEFDELDTIFTASLVVNF